MNFEISYEARREETQRTAALSFPYMGCRLSLYRHVRVKVVTLRHHEFLVSFTAVALTS